MVLHLPATDSRVRHMPNADAIDLAIVGSGRISRLSLSRWFRLSIGMIRGNRVISMSATQWLGRGACIIGTGIRVRDNKHGFADSPKPKWLPDEFAHK